MKIDEYFRRPVSEHLNANLSTRSGQKRSIYRRACERHNTVLPAPDVGRIFPAIIMSAHSPLPSVRPDRNGCRLFRAFVLYTPGRLRVGGLVGTVERGGHASYAPSPDRPGSRYSRLRPLSCRNTTRVRSGELSAPFSPVFLSLTNYNRRCVNTRPVYTPCIYTVRRRR